MNQARQRKIAALPDGPSEQVYWIVYNQDMVSYIEKEIADIKGQDYLDNHVKVLHLGSKMIGAKACQVFYDESVFSLLGNGNG